MLLREHLATARPALADVDAALDIAKTAAPNKVLPALLHLRARLMADDVGPQTVRPILVEALDAARQTGDPDLITNAMWEIAFNRYFAAEIDEMRRLLEEALEHVRRTGSKRAGLILFWLGKTAVFQGDLTAASAFVDEAIAAQPYKSKWYRAIEHWVRAGRAEDQGDSVTALAEARLSNALFREVGQPSFIAVTAWTVGEAMIALGDDAGARDVLAEAVDLCTRRDQRGQIPEVQARLAQALVHLGDVGAARVHAETARTVAMENDLESRFISAVALAEVREAEGNLAAADVLFREAIAIMEPSGIGDGLAQTREHYARFLLRHGRTEEARAHLDRVRAFWSDPLAQRHRERIDGLLRSAEPKTASI